MSFRSAATCFALVTTLFALTAAANAADWRVVQSSGDVWVGSDKAQPVALTTTTDVPGGATLTTGQTGRIMLMHGAQTMLVGPNSVATIPQDGDQTFVTVLQRAGRIEFDIDRQQTPHFAVETPFLAAVVKGTHFVVTVGAADADVSVDRGLVQVTDLATGEMADTPAGQRASVSGPNAKLAVGGAGQLAAIVPGTPRAPLVEQLSDQQLRAMQGHGAGVMSPAGAGGDRATEAAGGGLAVIAGNSGGNGSDGGSGTSGGNGGASGTGGDSGSATGSLPGDLGQAAPSQSVSLDIDAGHVFPVDRRSGSEGMTTMIVAGALALSVMLAFGFAFLRGRIT